MTTTRTLRGFLGVSVASAGGLLGAVPPAAATPPQYYITDLGVLPGGDDWSAAYRVNEYGQVTGHTGRYNGQGQLETQPFLWTPIAPNNIAGSMVGLGNFGGTIYGLGSSINNMGQVSGYAPDANGDRQAFVWTPSGGNNTPIGSKVAVGMVGSSSTLASGINSQGQMAGAVGNIPTLWTPNVPNGNTGSVLTLPYTGYGSARDINDSSQITGHMNGYDGTYQAVRWVDSGGGYTYTNIGDDGGATYYAPSAGAAINASGLVVGAYNSPDGINHAFMWDITGAITDILPNYVTDTRAGDVDDAGNVVGDAFFNNRLHAFLYTGGMAFDQSQFYDLENYIDPTLGWQLQGASGMNNFGQICGYGFINGETHGFLLTPVPGPGPAALGGAAGLTLVRRRRAPGTPRPVAA